MKVKAYRSNRVLQVQVSLHTRTKSMILIMAYLELCDRWLELTQDLSQQVLLFELRHLQERIGRTFIGYFAK